MIQVHTTIRAITLDAAGTLIAPQPSVGSIYAEVAADFGVDADPNDMQHAFQCAFRAATEDQEAPAPFDKPDSDQYLWWRGIVQETFTRAGQHVGFGVTFEKLYDTLYERFAQPDAWQIFPDVLPTLKQLHSANIPMAIISNWDTRLNSLIGATPIAPHVQFVLTSADAQSMKPHVAIFRKAAQMLRVAPRHLLHIGDSYRDDVLGARSAGYHALHIDRAATFSGASVIRSLGDIPSRLSQFR